MSVKPVLGPVVEGSVNDHHVETSSLETRVQNFVRKRDREGVHLDPIGFTQKLLIEELKKEGTVTTLSFHGKDRACAATLLTVAERLFKIGNDKEAAQAYRRALALGVISE